MSGSTFPSPGEILRKRFMVPREISIYRLAKDSGIPATRVSGILRGRRKINAESALRLARYFGNDPEYWLDIQNRYDLAEERRRLTDALYKIRSVS
ncbi:MAG TPA: HigA family addiction module antitoxin [Spirochaetia bacterium]|nr:HigA family addiction module antitoxin [Spirochaetales bacterium]HRY80018.1 HigA family addiction module antitoxin [Spirochaetia bacterium]